MNKTKIINQIVTLLYTSIGFLLVAYIIYVRIFLVRLPKSLQLHTTDSYYIIKLMFIFLSITHNTFYRITLFFSSLLDNSLKHFYSFIVSFFNDKYDMVSKISHRFYNYWSTIPEYNLLMYTYIIRFFILIIFLFEVFIYFSLNYFYKALILLCFILILKAFIFILRDFASNEETLKESLLIKEFTNEEGITSLQYSLKPEYEENDLNYIVNEYALCGKLKGYFEMYDIYSSYFNPRVNLIIYSLYFIGWLYVLSYNLYF